MFMHGGLLHLGGNMLFLWIFGNNVEDAMGPVKFLALLPAGPASRRWALQVVIDPSSTVPTLGASGAIAGVLGGYILLFPRARVVTVIFIVFFFTILELPALLVLGLLVPAAGAVRLLRPRPAGRRRGRRRVLRPHRRLRLRARRRALFASRKRGHPPDRNARGGAALIRRAVMWRRCCW